MLIPPDWTGRGVKAKINLKKIITILFLSLFLNSFGQDIHFSQFNSSPMNLNPSLTGLFNGDFRFVGNYKNQWSSIPAPFKTFSASADMKLIKIKNDQVGLGIVINNDKAGDSDFKTFQANVSISYLKPLSTNQGIGIGLQTGITNKSFNISKLTFDSQYNGTNYDPSLGSGETSSNTSFSYFDLSTGVTWFYKYNERTKFNIGTSYFHINKPKQSFFSNASVLLDPKFSINSSCQIKINTVIDLIPTLLFETQGEFRETIGGGSLKYLLLPQMGNETAVYLGGFYRGRDAFILSVAMDYNKFYLGISYDINNSPLKIASNNRGGVEMSLVYIVQKFIPVKHNKIPCPVFL